MATVIGQVQETAHLSFPIVRKSYTPEGDLIVYGKATDGTLDSDRQIVDPEWSGKALQEWLATGGNVRVQHSPNLYPAGKGIEVEVGKDGAHWVKALVVEPTAKTLVEKGVLTAYSVGIARPQIVRDYSAPGGKIVGGMIAELSLVDRPANKNCGITLVKSDSAGHAEFIGKVFGSPVPNPAQVASRIGKRDFSQAERDKASDEGAALPNGSYPIYTQKDADNAARLAMSGHGDVEAAKRHIRKRVRQLGLQLPESMKGNDVPDLVKGEKDCPNCGKDYHADSKQRTCENCGSKLPSADKADDSVDLGEREDADLEKGKVPPQFLEHMKKPQDDDEDDDSEPDDDEDDDKPAFLKNKGAVPTTGVEAKDSKPVGRHREPDGGVMEDFEDDAGLQEGDREPGGQGVPGSDWDAKPTANTPDTMKGEDDEEFVGKVGPHGYSHGWVKVSGPAPVKGDALAFDHGGKTFVGLHNGKSGSDHVNIAVPDKHERYGQQHTFRVPISEARRPKDGEHPMRMTPDTGHVRGSGSSYQSSHPATAEDAKNYKRKAGARAKIRQQTEQGQSNPGRGVINSAGQQVGKSEEPSYAVARLHDALCAAYHPDEITKAYPAVSSVASALADAWPDLDWYARQIVKSDEASWSTDPLLLGDARLSLTKAFSEMYPNVHLTPGSISAGQFSRPYVSAGHPPQSAQAAMHMPGPADAGFGSHEELRSPDQFNRDYLSAGHARESAGQGGNGNSIPGGRPAGARLAAAAKEQAANAMTNLHDHLASNHPYLCAMAPGSPDRLMAVSKSQVTELQTQLADLQKRYADDVSELRALIDQLGSQPDPNSAPHRGVLTKSASGGAGPADRRSLVEEAAVREMNERRAFFSQLAQHGDAGLREAARAVLGKHDDN